MQGSCIPSLDLGFLAATPWISAQSLATMVAQRAEEAFPHSGLEFAAVPRPVGDRVQTSGIAAHATGEEEAEPRRLVPGRPECRHYCLLLVLGRAEEGAVLVQGHR